MMRIKKGPWRPGKEASKNKFPDATKMSEFERATANADGEKSSPELTAQYVKVFCQINNLTHKE